MQSNVGQYVPLSIYYRWLIGVENILHIAARMPKQFSMTFFVLERQQLKILPALLIYLGMVALTKS